MFGVALLKNGGVELSGRKSSTATIAQGLPSSLPGRGEAGDGAVLLRGEQQAGPRPHHQNLVQEEHREGALQCWLIANDWCLIMFVCS